jgi:hypothetical protein
MVKIGDPAGLGLRLTWSSERPDEVTLQNHLNGYITVPLSELETQVAALKGVTCTYLLPQSSATKQAASFRPLSTRGGSLRTRSSSSMTVRRTEQPTFAGMRAR